MFLHLKKEKDFTRAILHPELVKGKIREEIKEIEHEKITVVIINHTKDQWSEDARLWGSKRNWQPFSQAIEKSLSQDNQEQERRHHSGGVKATENRQRPARTLSESFLVLQLTCTSQVHTGIGVISPVSETVSREAFWAGDVDLVP